MRPEGSITLAEYNRRFDIIIEAFRAGTLDAREANEAMDELSKQLVYHHEVKLEERRAVRP